MAQLRATIKALDPAPDKTKELTLALQLISELAENKAREFELDVAQSYRTAGTGENRTAPITLVVASHSEYRAYVKDDAGKLAENVAEGIKKFVAGGVGDIITGMADLVTTGLEAILGSGEATQQEMHSYYLTVEGKALVRYDIYAWRRRIEATGITSKIECCMALYASKASVDVMEIDLNTFLLAYRNQLAKMEIDDKDAIEYVKRAEEVYLYLRGQGNGNLNTFAPGNPSLIRNSFRLDPQSAGDMAFYPPIATA